MHTHYRYVHKAVHRSRVWLAILGEQHSVAFVMSWVETSLFDWRLMFWSNCSCVSLIPLAVMLIYSLSTAHFYYTTHTHTCTHGAHTYVHTWHKFERTDVRES